MTAEQEARDEAVRQLAHTAWCHAAVAAMTCNCDAEVWRDGFTTGATWQAARDAETIAGLRAWKDEALPVMAGLQDLGRILGVRLGTSITGESAAQAARALVARADAAEARVRAAWDEGHSAGWNDAAEYEHRMQMRDWWAPMPATPNPYPALATPEPTVQTADYGPMGDPTHETGPDETYCRVCKRLALEHLPSEWSPYGTCPTQAWPQEDS